MNKKILIEKINRIKEYAEKNFIENDIIDGVHIVISDEQNIINAYFSKGVK